MAKSHFHGKEQVDYAGRSWIEPPKDKHKENDYAFLPKRCIHTWSGHSKGVNAIRFFPQHGHFIAVGRAGWQDQDLGRLQLWEVHAGLPGLHQGTHCVLHTHSFEQTPAPLCTLWVSMPTSREHVHFLLLAGLDGKIWDVFNFGKCMREYLGFTKVRPFLIGVMSYACSCVLGFTKRTPCCWLL